MIAAVEELEPLVGQRAAHVATGTSRATSHRRRRPPEPRAARPRAAPASRLSDAERGEILEVMGSDRFIDTSPGAVVATLMDEGRYLASERSVYRVLADAAGAPVRERRRQLTHPAYTRPELIATAPNQVYTWDISKLRGPVKHSYFLLYSIIDIFSRYTPGWMVADRESELLAERFIADTIMAQGIEPDQLILHADRGPSMRSKTVAQMLADLGVDKTHSRPYTSTDNPYSEAAFKTLKYRPDYPNRFDDIAHATSWAAGFFGWYNNHHRHSGICMLTPADVHYGRATQRLAERQRVMNAAYHAHPERFSRPPLIHALPAAVYINPPAEDPATDNTLTADKPTDILTSRAREDDG